MVRLKLGLLLDLSVTILLGLSIAPKARAAGPQPCYFSGTFVKCFPSAGIDLTTAGQGIKFVTSGSTPAALNFYADSGETSYAGTLQWNCSVAPSSTLTTKYRWTKVGAVTTIEILGVYAVAGTSCVSLVVNLPTGAPKPSGFGVVTTANRYVMNCLGAIETSDGAASLADIDQCVLTFDTGTPHFEIRAASVNAGFYRVVATYFDNGTFTP